MQSRILVLGDVLALVLVTLIGFASHGELSMAFLPRMAASLLPLLLGWFLLAPLLGLYQASISGRGSQLWRPAFAMLFAGPLAALLRGLLLQAPVIPSFAVVLTATSAAGLSLWRLLWFLWSRRRSP